MTKVISFSTDGGVTWNYVGDGLRVLVEDPEGVNINFNFTVEGLITDVISRDRGAVLGTSSDMYDQIEDDLTSGDHQVDTTVTDTQAVAEQETKPPHNLFDFKKAADDSSGYYLSVTLASLMSQQHVTDALSALFNTGSVAGMFALYRVSDMAYRVVFRRELVDDFNFILAVKEDNKIHGWDWAAAAQFRREMVEAIAAVEDPRSSEITLYAELQSQLDTCCDAVWPPGFDHPDKYNRLPKFVAAALREVRKHFPEVTQVMFGRDGTWMYCDDFYRSPDFANKVSHDVLNKALDDVRSLPAAFAIWEKN